MDSTQPPPIPGGQRPVQTYIAAVLMSVPALMLLIFSVIVHLPRLEMLWRNAGFGGSRMQWMLDASRQIPTCLNFVLLGVVLVLIVVEHKWPGWRRWRRTVLFGVAIALQIIVMVELTFVTTASQLAATKVLRETAKP